MNPEVFAALPAELRERRQWVVWRYESRTGKRTKVPFRIDTGQRADVTDPATWADLDLACKMAAQPGVDGMGYVFTPDDPFCGIDLDACRMDGKLHPEAAAILEDIASYAEISVSGTGLHIIGRASLNGHGRNRTGSTPWGGGLEVYDQDRFFVVTGARIATSPPRPTHCQAALDRLLARLLPQNPRIPGPDSGPGGGGFEGTDRELLDTAFRASNGAKIEALYNGSLAGYPSPSEAIAALLGLLVFYTGRDLDRLDRLFRGSG